MIVPLETMPADATVVATIQAVIPLGLRAVEDALQQDVTRLAGPRYAHGDGQPDLVWWGRQQGSVFLADQKLVVDVPRVRDRARLVILDGAKGLRAAVHDVFGTPAHVQCCQWHKRENVVGHLPLRLKPLWRRKLQAAYEQPTYAAAHAALTRCQRELRELRRVNLSAAGSLAEGLEETLTMHRLGVFTELGTSFKTTNLIESVMARVEARRRRVTYWRTSDQKHRWCAAALLALEAQFRRIKGFRHLPLLIRALRANVEVKLKVAA